jgi:hypothetical protein
MRQVSLAAVTAMALMNTGAQAASPDVCSWAKWHYSSDPEVCTTPDNMPVAGCREAAWERYQRMLRDGHCLTPPSVSANLGVSKRDHLTALLQGQFKACFTPPPGARAKKGVRPVIHIHFSGIDGSLAGRPVIENPPSDPGSRALTEAMARSVARCAPYRIPTQYAQYFEQWKDVSILVDLSWFE